MIYTDETGRTYSWVEAPEVKPSPRFPDAEDLERFRERMVMEDARRDFMVTMLRPVWATSRVWKFVPLPDWSHRHGEARREASALRSRAYARSVR